MTDNGISIQVSVRCRPFTQADHLGLKMSKLSDHKSELTLLHSKVIFKF